MALCSDHRFADALMSVPSALRQALEGAGMRRPGVFLRAFSDDPLDAAALARQLLPGAEPEDAEDAGRVLLELRAVAGPGAERALRVFAHADPLELMEGFLAGEAERQAKARRVLTCAELRTADAAWKPAVRPGRFRLRGDARMAAASGPVARAEAEAAERATWCEALVELLLEAGGPIVDATRAASDPRKALAAAAGGRRFRTLAKRIRSWRRLREWCLKVYSSPYPSSPLHLVEYLQARADEPCGLSALQAVAELFVFTEGCRGVPPGARLVDDPYYAAYRKELEVQHAGAGPLGTRKAPRLPIPFVIALEREVVEDFAPPFYRAYAWWQLVSIWGSLRFDDHRGLAPAQVDFRDGRFTGTLSRTKTTGPGKRVQTLHVVISAESFLVYPNWLAEGWALWAKVAPFVRDYFLTRPTPDLAGALPIEMTYGESAWLLRGLLSGLPRFGEALACHASPLVPLFTQHSGRCWVSSLAALLGIEEARIGYLGRWSPSTARGYVRTADEVIRGVQAEVARRVRRDISSGDEVLFGEDQAARSIAVELEGRGAQPEEVERVLTGLRAWTHELIGELPLGAPSTPRRVSSPDPALAFAVVDDFPDEQESWGVDEELCAVLDAAAPEEILPGTADASRDLPEPPRSAAEPPPPLPLEDHADLSAPEEGFVCSVSKAGWRRLHRLGGCARLPGIHYLEYDFLGVERPTLDQYDDYCKQCWRGDADPQDGSEDAESNSEEEEELEVNLRP